MGFNLNDYEDVAARIKRFREKYDSGRIVVDVISHDVKEGVILVEASVYRYAEDTLPAATDIAIGIAATYNANMRKFYAEDTSTSAIGRAIGLLLGSDKRPTKEDMVKVKPSESDSARNLELAQTGTRIKGGEERLDMWGDAVGLIKKELNAEVIETLPHCNHGEMTIKEGTGKTGKPYRGYVCTAPKAQQCAPMWMNLTAQGTWVLQNQMEK